MGPDAVSQVVFQVRLRPAGEGGRVHREVSVGATSGEGSGVGLSAVLHLRYETTILYSTLNDDYLYSCSAHLCCTEHG